MVGALCGVGAFVAGAGRLVAGRRHPLYSERDAVGRAYLVSMTDLITRSFPLFRFKGIQVLMHWSFLLLLAWVLITTLGTGKGLQHAGFQLGAVLIVFACVVLHEFGHALTALHYGVRTRSILLLPIGGVATLERMPEEPRQELMITLAGPAVNLVIASIVGMILWLAGSIPNVSIMTESPSSLFTLGIFLLSVNVVLFLFNLVPAFPMDGGRILRSILAMNMDRVKATRIAGRIGVFFALGFVLAAFKWGDPMLGLIGVFVYLGASAETRLVQEQRALRDVRVREVMRTKFWSMPATATVQDALAELLAGGDHTLVVMRDGDFSHLLTREELIAVPAAERHERSLGVLNGAKPPGVEPDAWMRTVHEKLMTGSWALLPVLERDKLIGVLELDNLAEYISIHEPAQST